MILVCRSAYDGHTDSIQVAVIVQNDDGTSAASEVQSGTVEVLSHGTTMFSEDFNSDHKMIWYDPNDGSEEDRGNFYFFLHHPPIQKDLSTRVTVNLVGDRVLKQKVDVDVDAEPNTHKWQNPALSGRDAIVFDVDPTFP